MKNYFEYNIENKWPTLAWLAICQKGKPSIRIQHGKGVEVKKEWFCEAVWDGSFEEGGFDQTDLVFGSGGRIRDGVPVFVSSGATCDRLQFFRQGDITYISNSLACIKAFSSGWPDISFFEYGKFFLSIEDGIDRYKRIVPKNGPTLAYYRNLTWNGENLSFCDKPWPERQFTSFAAYVDFVKGVLKQIGSNLSSLSRTFRLSPIGNISSGYDSATSSALARSAGLKEVITFKAARGELKDDGFDIAEYLGLQVKMFDRMAWDSSLFVEVPFFAADGEAGELFYTATSEALKSRVMFTGNHGDKMWDVHRKYGVTPEIRGGGQSGLSLTEYRLVTGTIHVPVPFIGVRNIAEINAISNSPEMDPWDIGGDYNRPICRRILEEAGVPRELFGQEKKASATLFRRGDALLTRPTRIALFQWVLSKSNDSKKLESKLQCTRDLIVARWFIPEIWSFVEKSIRRLLRMAPNSFEKGISWRLYKIRNQIFLSANFLEPHAFPWAINLLSELYKSTTGTARSEGVDRFPDRQSA